MKHPTNTVSPPRIGLWSLPPWRCLMYVLTWTIPLFIEKWRLPLSDFPVLVVAIILLCSCIHVDVNTCTQLYNLLCKTFIILISSKTMSYSFSCVLSFTKIQLRPTPWRTFPPTCFTASPHTMKDATGVPPERPFIYVSRAWRKARSLSRKEHHETACGT